jgi:L-amino acid N-acyltransferase YncA
MLLTRLWLKMPCVESIIDTMQPSDWEQVKDIYLGGIATGNATFETDAPSWAAWDAAHLPFSRLVARAGDSIIGWAALSPVSSRCIYAGVAEVSVYVAADARGKGIGRALLAELISSSEMNGIWTLQAGILVENTASILLHKRCGFREVGRRERIGKLGHAWRDVMLMERRSRTIGIT